MYNAETVLKAEHITKRFTLPGGHQLMAVDDVSFTIHEGECLGVIGESGCGKSTLARIISGVETADEGHAELMGQDILHMKGRELKRIRRDMQMIFQNASSVVSPKMKLKDFMMEPYINYHLMTKAEARQHIIGMLKKVRLNEDVLGKYAHQVSGGEMQRVCIARTFGMQPKFLLCDEITSALDVSVQNEVMQLFRQNQQEAGIACLFICHDLALVQSCTDRVMAMYLGQMVELMDSRELGQKAMHPYTQGLLKSMLLIDGDRQVNESALSGEPVSPVDVKPCCRFCTRCPKAQERCFHEKPPCKEVEEGHWVACFMV